MTSAGVLVEERDAVRRVVLDRPEKKNALTAAMYDVLADAIESASSDDVGALLVTARGDAFTAGNDLNDFLAHPPHGEDAPVFRFLLALALTDVPIVAAVRGAAIGIGTTMLLHCDVVYAAPSARFRLPFVDLALVPEGGSTLLLPRLVGRARAGALFLGETIEPAEALDAGLVTRIVDDATLESEAETAARTIATKPRAALHATKRLITHDRTAVVDAIRREAEVFAERLASAEARATMAAFVAKGGRT